MRKGLTGLLGLAVVGVGLTLVQPAYATDCPEGIDYKCPEKVIDKIKMPDGVFYEIYKSSNSPFGFKILPPQGSNKIRVGLEGGVHKITGDFYELYDEDGSDKEDRLVYIRDKCETGFERTGNLSLAASMQKKDVKVELKRYKGKEGGYIVEVNGIGREFFDSRTIDGREFLIMHDVRGTGKERLEWYFIPMSGIQLELTGNGEISFISNKGVYSTRRVSE